MPYICNWIFLVALAYGSYSLAWQIEIPKGRETTQHLSVAPSQDSLKLDSIRYPEQNPLPPFIQKIRERKYSYLLPADVQNIKVLSPPANSSVQTVAELNYLVRLQKLRTPGVVSELRKIDFLEESESSDFKWQSDDFQGPFTVGYFLGKSFRRSLMPKTRKLVNLVSRDIEKLCYEKKFEFRRPRPYQLKSEITSALEDGVVPPHPSYPAGHACIGYGAAELFSLLSPGHKKEFIQLGEQIAVSREWAGIHYPSDSEAGKTLARQLIEKMSVRDNFKADFSAAQKEWAKFR